MKSKIVRFTVDGVNVKGTFSYSKGINAEGIIQKITTIVWTTDSERYDVL